MRRQLLRRLSKSGFNVVDFVQGICEGDDHDTMIEDAIGEAMAVLGLHADDAYEPTASIITEWIDGVLSADTDVFRLIGMGGGDLSEVHDLSNAWIGSQIKSMEE